MVLTHRFILTKDADYLYPNKANWSFTLDSDQNLRFTKPSYFLYTSKAKILCAYLTVLAPRLDIPSYYRGTLKRRTVLTLLTTRTGAAHGNRTRS